MIKVKGSDGQKDQCASLSLFVFLRAKLSFIPLIKLNKKDGRFV